MRTDKILILGYGNPGRGDDALGPELLASIERVQLAGVECQSDMQLQVEHVIDLERRSAIIFVDADASCDPPFQFAKIRAEKDGSYSSHAMSPPALLHAYQQVFKQESPPSFLLRIRGYQFELGENMSESAANNLACAVSFTEQLCITAPTHWLSDHLASISESEAAAGFTISSGSFTPQTEQ